jgi:hypothetical protein
MTKVSELLLQSVEREVEVREVGFGVRKLDVQLREGDLQTDDRRWNVLELRRGVHALLSEVVERELEARELRFRTGESASQVRKRGLGRRERSGEMLD